VTVVEAIRQLIDTDRNARILACAPSNDAADLLALKLKDFGPRIIFRLNAPSRNYDERRYELDSISRQEDGIYRIPPREELERFRIVVSTCLSAAVPLGIGVEPGHFSHIFLDEAAQAMEPEPLYR
jgi:helicase MOV-10